jgi:DUF438 domain-containing protein
MSEGLGKSDKKEAMKDIIRKLHQGLSAERAKERFLREVGNISSVEIAEIEQSLIGEGMKPEEIQKFCNVHAMLFESNLQVAVGAEESPSHPVYLFKLENREIEKITKKLRELTTGEMGFEASRAALYERLEELQGVDIHYKRKENILFPFLEKHEFSGPSKVMWGKHDEIRDLLRESLDHVQKLNGEEALKEYAKRFIEPLVEEVEGMIFKEESILFPTALEKLSVGEWAEVFTDSADLGYVFIEEPKESAELTHDLREALTEMATVRDAETIALPTGSFSPEELTTVLNTLPIDVTFIDREDRVRYFSESADRIFVRTKAVLGRTVQLCHPPQSVAIVEEILESFRSGARDDVDFWLHLKGRLIYIRYFALRDAEGEYLGTLEVTQDVTDIRRLEGEKRLLDEGELRRR